MVSHGEANSWEWPAEAALALPPFRPWEREYLMGNCLRVTAASNPCAAIHHSSRCGWNDVGRPGEGEVDIVAWAGYVERGDSDKAYDWVTDFEKATGCKSTSRLPAPPTRW